MKRGRPVSTSALWEFHVHLRLRVGEEDDLIVFLSNLPKGRRALALKTALRSGGLQVVAADPVDSDDELFSSLDDFLK
jgi:hypothetical protein